MSPARIELLASDLWDHVFTQLDNEIDLTGEEAGVIAQYVQDAFSKAMTNLVETGSVYSSDLAALLA